MPFDYKKEQREFYGPSRKPELIEIPKMQYIAVRGKGNPNETDGEYQTAIELLYALSFTLKMSYKGGRSIEGYFPYVVPPLEGLWQTMDGKVDYRNKKNFQWISMIRLPDFIKKEDFEWAIAAASQKKKMDFSKAEFFTYNEGLCVQCMHIGRYDDEPATIAAMTAYVSEQGYSVSSDGQRYHHEIYLSDPRKCIPEKCKTIIRIPIKKAECIVQM